MQKQPNKHSCFPTAFAIIMDISVADLISAIGHDGSEVIYPGLEYPFNMRGFHEQEISLVAWRLGFSVTRFDDSILATSSVTMADEDIIINETPFDLFTIMKESEGVLVSDNHAVAWNGDAVIDPKDGLVRSASEYLKKAIYYYAVAKRRRRYLRDY